MQPGLRTTDLLKSKALSMKILRFSDLPKGMLLLIGLGSQIVVLWLFLHYSAFSHVHKQMHLASLFLLCMFSGLASIRKWWFPLCPSLNHTFWDTRTSTFVSATLFSPIFQSLIHCCSPEFWVSFWTFNSAFEYFLKKKFPFKFFLFNVFVEFLQTTWIHSVWMVPSLPFSFFQGSFAFFSVLFPQLTL